MFKRSPVSQLVKQEGVADPQLQKPAIVTGVTTDVDSLSKYTTVPNTTTPVTTSDKSPRLCSLLPAISLSFHRDRDTLQGNVFIVAYSSHYE